MFIGAHGVGILWYSRSLGAVGFIYRYTVFCTVLSRYTHTCNIYVPSSSGLKMRVLEFYPVSFGLS